MSIIVVEGCDGSGKTTLIEQARGNQKDRYFVVCRASRYQPNVKTAFQYLAWLKKQTDLDLILDRFHFISDRIYGPIIRNEDVFRDMPLTFGLQGVSAVVYARPPDTVIHGNVGKDRLQLEGVLERTQRIIGEYDLLMAKLMAQGIPVHKYDYTVDDPVTFWRYIWSKIEREKSNA